MMENVEWDHAKRGLIHFRTYKGGENVEDSHLLDIFLSLWNKREVKVGSNSPTATVKEMMKSELLDEFSHPRVRKTKEEKYFLAVKRVIDSDLKTEDQIRLIRLYTDVMESFK